jgi:hypothetical protein
MQQLVNPSQNRASQEPPIVTTQSEGSSTQSAQKQSSSMGVLHSETGIDIKA